MADKPTTQQLVEIKEVKDNTVYLKGGGMRAVIMVSGMNFDLKSEEEQKIVLYGFQNFLNALDFSVQFVVHSRKLNIDPYLRTLQKREIEESNELLKMHIGEYREFIKSFIEMNAIMSKIFYVVIPYEAPALTTEKSAGFLGGLFGSSKKSATEKEEKERADDAARRAQLEQRVDQALNNIMRIGLRAVRLEDEELTELFYNLYNPEGQEKSLAIAKGLDVSTQ